MGAIVYVVGSRSSSSSAYSHTRTHCCTSLFSLFLSLFFHICQPCIYLSICLRLFISTSLPSSFLFPLSVSYSLFSLAFSTTLPLLSHTSLSLSFSPNPSPPLSLWTCKAPLQMNPSTPVAAEGPAIQTAARPDKRPVRAAPLWGDESCLPDRQHSKYIFIVWAEITREHRGTEILYRLLETSDSDFR